MHLVAVNHHLSLGASCLGQPLSFPVLHDLSSFAKYSIGEQSIFKGELKNILEEKDILKGFSWFTFLG